MINLYNNIGYKILKKRQISKKNIISHNIEESKLLPTKVFEDDLSISALKNYLNGFTRFDYSIIAIAFGTFLNSHIFCYKKSRLKDFYNHYLNIIISKKYVKSKIYTYD